jgi:hypothetical protein
LNQGIAVISKLNVEQRPALEQLLFFNVNQHRVRNGIEDSIRTYGMPQICEREGSLRIDFAAVGDVQNLFAVNTDGRPIGVALFMRAGEDRFVVIHVGVEPPPGKQSGANPPVLFKLMHAVRRAARRTRGIQRIEYAYRRGDSRSIKLVLAPRQNA